MRLVFTHVYAFVAMPGSRSDNHPVQLDHLVAKGFLDTRAATGQMANRVYCMRLA